MGARRCANAYGLYLEVVKYGNSGRKGTLIIPKGLRGDGWDSFASELKCTVSLIIMASEKALQLNYLVD